MQMDDGQPAKSLSDYVSLQRGNTYKSALLGQEGPVLLGLASIARNGGFRSDSLKTYGGPSDERILLEAGDIYVSLKDVTQSADLLGAVARVPNEILQGRLTQDTVKLVFKSEGATKAYIYWLLRTPQYREFCKAHATGTTNLGLPRGDFLAFSIPELTPERCTLLELLQSLDDKIELNRRMNETLEAMARAIFKDWFVDFGPTRAKAEGRPPYLAPNLWELFPDALDEEGKPVGWTRAPIEDFISLAQNGGTPPRRSAEFWSNGNVNWFRTGELRDGYLLSSERRITRAGLARIGSKLWPPGTILFAIYASPTVGRMGILKECGSANQACTALVPVDEVGTPFLFEALHACRKDLRNIAVGAAQQNISQKVLLEHRIVRPGGALTQCYSTLIEPFFERILNNTSEAATLATLRDLLLPKLMSGEIRLREAEKAVEAVA